MLQFFEGIKRHVQFVIWHFIHSKKQNILYTYYNVRQIIKNRRSKYILPPGGEISFSCMLFIVASRRFVL